MQAFDLRKQICFQQVVVLDVTNDGSWVFVVHTGFALRGNPVVRAKLVHHGYVAAHLYWDLLTLRAKHELISLAISVRVIVELHE